jgi:acetolactate synthase-1/2/3 large subunit
VKIPKHTIYCLDSGQIRRAGSIFLTSYFKRTLLQSETLSPMGLGICSSIGAQLAKTSNRVVCLTGDGSMRMNGIELATAVRYDLPIIFILCDNKSYASTKAPEQAKELPYIDWELYAESFGLQSCYVNNKLDFSNKLTDALLNDKPILIWTEVPYLLNDELQKTEKIEYKNWLSAI